MLITENQLRNLIRNILKEEISEEDGLMGEEERAIEEAIAAIDGEEEYEFEGEKLKVSISYNDAEKLIREKAPLQMQNNGMLGTIGKVGQVVSGIFSLKMMVDQMRSS